MPHVLGPDLTGKVALVTGASSGIGRAVAIALGQAGADVAINYSRQSGPAESAAAEIHKLGRKGLPVQADVSNQEAVEAMVAKTVKELGGIDIFISSAAYSDREPFHTANMDGFRKTIEVSLFGAYYGLRASTNRMIEQGNPAKQLAELGLDAVGIAAAARELAAARARTGS